MQRARAGRTVRVAGGRPARRGNVREPDFVAGDGGVYACNSVKYLHSYASFRVSLRLLNVIALQTYVGDCGEELLEGRFDVADFFD